MPAVVSAGAGGVAHTAGVVLVLGCLRVWVVRRLRCRLANAWQHLPRCCSLAAGSFPGTPTPPPPAATPSASEARVQRRWRLRTHKAPERGRLLWDAGWRVLVLRGASKP